MTQPDPAVPEFAVVLRGYDRLQVDEYVDRLQRLVEESEERLRVAERSREDQVHAEVGPRITQIFDLAQAEALDLREGAQHEADIILSAARREASELVAGAEAEARAIAERAEAHRRETIAAQEAESERLRAEARALEGRRDAVLAELQRLRDTLTGMAPAAGNELRTLEIDPGTSGAHAELAPTQEIGALGAGPGDTVEHPALGAGSETFWEDLPAPGEPTGE